MKTWLKITLSSIFTISVIVLLAVFDKVQREAEVPDPIVRVKTSKQNAFLDDEEVIRRLKYAHLLYDNQRFEDLKTDSISEFLLSISQVKDVKVYRNFGNTWNIDLTLREPIARVFNKAGESFYIDSEGYRMLISPQFTAHVLVVNGHITEAPKGIAYNEIINNDSLKSIHKLDDIYRISKYVCNDPLLQALVGQIYLEADGDFLLVPLVGDQKIVFGSAYSEKEVAEKFKKLKIFYREAMAVEGWDKYSEINLKYRDQIVCKRKEELTN